MIECRLIQKKCGGGWGGMLGVGIERCGVNV